MCKAMEVDTLSEEYGPVKTPSLEERVAQLEEENKRITSILEKAIDILAMRSGNVRN